MNFNFSYFGLFVHEDFALNFHFSQGADNGQEMGVRANLYFNVVYPCSINVLVLEHV